MTVTRRQDLLRVVRTAEERAASRRWAEESLERVASGTGPLAELAADTLAQCRRGHAAEG